MHIQDCLPVCLMFDMREDGEADPCKMAQMMQNLGVFISVKPKVKQTSKVQFINVALLLCYCPHLKRNGNFVVLFHQFRLFEFTFNLGLHSSVCDC